MVPLRSLLVLCLVTSLVAAQDGALKLPLTSKLMDKWAKAPDCPGQLVVVVSDGRPWIRAVGYADIEKKLPFQDWTRIPLGGLTRDLLHVGIDLAAKEGLLDPEEAVGVALRGRGKLPKDVRKISWLDLLEKRRLPAYYYFSASLGVMRSMDVVVREHVFTSPVNGPYDSHSHAETAVLQHALEQVVRMPWSRYLKEVLAPSLGIHGTVDASALGWTGGLKVYGKPDKAGKRQAAEPLFAEVPAAYNAWTCANDIPHYLKSILKVPKEEEDRRFHEWQNEEDVMRGMHYITRTEAHRSASCVVHAFRGEDLAMFWFSNAPGSGHSDAVREAVLRDLYGDPPERMAWPLAVGVGCGGAGGSWSSVRRSWRGTLRVGHSRPKDIPIEISIRDTVETLQAKGDCVTGYRLYVNPNGGSGTIVLSDPGGKVEFNLVGSGEDLVGVASWRNGPNVLLPRQLTLTSCPRNSKRYPPAPKGTVK
jgi:CubicO group peptidase (beta-lactamase class C family)